MDYYPTQKDRTITLEEVKLSGWRGKIINARRLNRIGIVNMLCKKIEYEKLTFYSNIPFSVMSCRHIIQM